MKQGILLLQWSVSAPFLPRSPPLQKNSKHTPFIVSAAVEPANQAALTARERRQLRNERRESGNWREELEERMMKKRSKKPTRSLDEELNLDNLAKLGPQWWVVRVGRVRSHDTAERLATVLARNFPDIDFQVYIPSVQTKRKLKNGTISVKPQPLFPGCLYLRCVMNREIHDFIKEYEGVGAFIGSKVGNKLRQIFKPRPVGEEDMEEIFRKAKEEQEKHDQAFEEEQKTEAAPEAAKSVSPTKRGRRVKKASEPLGTGADNKILVPGSTVLVVSGTFSGFSGILKKLDKKAGLATVGFTVFGKETLADLNVKEIVAEFD